VRKVFAVAAALLVVAGAAYFFFVLPAQVAANMNATLAPPPYAASTRAQALHRSLVIADLHADTLLWERNVIERGAYGHADVPRLLEGNVAIQAFTIVTQTPWDIQPDGNDPSSDAITLLALANRWPVPTWRSLTARALHQAGRLQRAAVGSRGQLTLIRTRDDLERYLQRRASERSITAGFLGVEGAHALDGDLNNVGVLFDAGVRMMSLTHLADNTFGGSAQGITKGGLTDAGRALIRRMEARQMTIDLAHSSPLAFGEAVAMATRPVVVSHTGVRGTCDNSRNLTDDQVRAVAKTGGVIGIGYWETATCGTDARAVARAIRHAVEVAGIDAVGLGSDFDGAILAPFDTTGLVQITDALLAAGFSETEIRAVTGGNVIRVLRANLPARAP
jgi:microsomal dipeptidase-like Zn-dependent dipeptidase